MMLTKEKLIQMPAGSVIGTGTTTNDPEGIFMIREHPHRLLRWVAIGGHYNDWVIYIGWEERLPEDSIFTPCGIDMVVTNGDKVRGHHNIQKLVPCDDTALQCYRA